MFLQLRLVVEELPQGSLEQRTGAMSKSSQAAARPPLKILVIEDSPLLRNRLIGMLAQHVEMQVTGHAAGETEAIAKMKTVPHDALIVDVELRPGTGLGVIRAARAEEMQPTTAAKPSIIVLTNYDLPTVRERCIEAGADYFLDKMREIDRLIPLLLEIHSRQSDSTLHR
ncbi:MAG TPA: response regulator [Steroidobacteraceae bacterium]|nr:response regulator [Steroidobacteraceae bacterium]